MTGFTPLSQLPYPEPGDDLREAPGVFAELAAALDVTAFYEVRTQTFTESGIGPYSAGNVVTISRFGPLVMVTGVGTTTSDAARTAVGGSGVSSANTVVRLPSDVRPVTPIYAVCQGSGTSKWMLLVNTDGVVSAQRYEGTVPSKPWLNFGAVYLADPAHMGD